MKATYLPRKGNLASDAELDDVHRQGVLHVGAVTLPALIAVAENHARLSGSEFLAAAFAVTLLASFPAGAKGPFARGQEKEITLDWVYKKPPSPSMRPFGRKLLRDRDAPARRQRQAGDS